MTQSGKPHGTTLVELMVTLTVASAVGFVLFGLLNTNMVLGAKNTAINTAHQQARVAMLQMVQDLHASVSQPQLTNVDANGQATGISFQQWAAGPWQIVQDVTFGATIRIWAATAPQVGQHLIVPTHQIEDAIVTVQNLGLGFYDVTLAHYLGWPKLPAPASPTDLNPVPIKPALSTLGDVTCFITNACSYVVSNSALTWNSGTNITRVMANGITNSKGVLYDPNQPATDPNLPPAPFSMPTTQAGAPYTRFVSAVDLSTADIAYSNRGYKAANILLNGQVPYRARLTTYTGAAPSPTP